MDGWHSIVRYFMNNFSDGFRQDGMHLLLGQYVVHEADGMTPKPLTGPQGLGRRGSGHADTEWRTLFLPVSSLLAMAMTVMCLIASASESFWGRSSGRFPPVERLGHFGAVCSPSLCSAFNASVSDAEAFSGLHTFALTHGQYVWQLADKIVVGRHFLLPAWRG